MFKCTCNRLYSSCIHACNLLITVDMFTIQYFVSVIPTSPCDGGNILSQNKILYQLESNYSPCSLTGRILRALQPKTKTYQLNVLAFFQGNWHPFLSPLALDVEMFHLGSQVSDQIKLNKAWEGGNIDRHIRPIVMYLIVGFVGETLIRI